MLPCVLVTVELPASQVQAANVALLAFIVGALLVGKVRLKPSLFSDVIPPESVTSAAVDADTRYLVTPLTESTKAWVLAALRHLIHTKSGEKFSPLMVCVLPLPVYNATSIAVLPSAIVGSGRLVVQSALKPLRG